MWANVNTTIPKQSKREVAHSGLLKQQSFAKQQYCLRHEIVVDHSSNWSATNSLHRYPSPNRSAYSPSRPITVFRRYGPDLLHDIGYHAGIAIHRCAVRTNSGATYETTIGLRLCKRHQSSLRQWQYLVWQVALRATQSVASQAQALALLPQKYWALTAQALSLPVLPQACFATTQASTLVSNTPALSGRHHPANRRRGPSPAAVSCFGD